MDSGTFSPELTVPHNDVWVDVESRPGEFIVLGGEALQRLTNGLIFAAKHKVGLTGKSTGNLTTDWTFHLRWCANCMHFT